jgi:hypothetical protein
MPRKSIKLICARLDPNSSYNSNNSTAKSTEIKERFVQCGWQRSFIEAKLAKLDDSLLNGWKIDEFMEEYAKAEIHRPETYPTMKESMMEFGVCEEIAEHVQFVMEPLHNTCYTSSQMIDVALEYLVGRYAPLCP